MATPSHEKIKRISNNAQHVFTSPHNADYVGLHVRCPIFLSDFNQTQISPTDLSESLPYQILRKSVQWELIHAEGWTDGHDKAISELRTCQNTKHDTNIYHISYHKTQIAHTVTRSGFYRHISRQSPILNFTKTRPERGHICGRADGHDKANNVNPATGHDPWPVPLRLLLSSQFRFVSSQSAS